MKMISKYGCFRLLAVLIAGVLGSHVAIGAPTDGAQLLARRAQLQAELQAQAFVRTDVIGVGAAHGSRPQARRHACYHVPHGLPHGG